MTSIINGDKMDSFEDSAKVEVETLNEIAEVLSQAGQKDLADKLIQQMATLEVLSVVGPLSHRLKSPGRPKNSNWDLIIELAEGEIVRNPYRRYGAATLAKVVREQLKRFHPDLRESDIPKIDTISRQVKKLADRTPIARPETLDQADILS